MYIKKIVNYCFDIKYTKDPFWRDAAILINLGDNEKQNKDKTLFVFCMLCVFYSVLYML